MRALIAAAAIAALMGCAGTNFSYDKARQVEVGMTEAELIGLMGSPYSVTSRSGSQLWIWSHANVFGSARTVSFEIKDGRVFAVPSIPNNFK